MDPNKSLDPATADTLVSALFELSAAQFKLASIL
jgi:hypothetical protein